MIVYVIMLASINNLTARGSGKFCRSYVCFSFNIRLKNKARKAMIFLAFLFAFERSMCAKRRDKNF